MGTITSGEFAWELDKRTHLVGVLNITPDSFSDGGKYFTVDNAVKRGMELIEAGADWVDVGGESTRPGAESVSETEELRRVMPVIERLAHKNIPISIDTCKSSVAKAAAKAGAVVFNDISGLGFDPKIADTAAEFDSILVIMHIKGTPRNMQDNPHYQDLMGEIIEYFYQRTDFALKAGVRRDKIVIDPGIGFGKSVSDNFEILRRLRELSVLGYPILLGVSRKSFIGKVLNLPVDQRLFGTCGACAAAAVNGAAILRVHDPGEVLQAVTVVDYICGKRTFDQDG